MEPIDNKEFLLNSARAVFDSAQFSAAQAIAPPHKLNPAQWAYERIKSLIYDFERGLSPEEEVGCRLVSFGNTSVYYIDDVSYWGPDIIIFHCTDASSSVKADLIQHISQLNVLLIKLPRKADEPKARRIGFNISQEQDSDTE